MYKIMNYLIMVVLLFPIGVKGSSFSFGEVKIQSMKTINKAIEDSKTERFDPDTSKLEVIELSPLVGKTIDDIENSQFELFDIKDFEEAMIIKEDTSFYLLIRSKRDVSIEPLPYQKLVNLRGKLKKAKESLGAGFKPGIFRPDPNHSRLFIMPTGNTLKKSQRYFSDYELIFVWMAYGVTNNFMVDFGFTLIPTTPDNWLYYFGPKVKVLDIGKGRYLSVGAHFIALPFMQYAEDRFWGAVYTSFTQERPGTQITFGGGAGNAVLTPVGSNLFGAYVGIKKGLGKIKFLGEYWHLLIKKSNGQYNNIPNLFIGARFCGKNITVDFGLFYPYLSDFVQYSPVGIPFINFVYFY